MRPVLRTLVTLLATCAFLTSCLDDEDPGPLQPARQDFAVADFDRLDMGDAFNIQVQYGDSFAVSAFGDRRNIDDVVATVHNGTLLMRFSNNRSRQHDTDITITLPALTAVEFSGASRSSISGFGLFETLDLSLSGASLCEMEADVTDLKLSLSGASTLAITGASTIMDAQLSGASRLKAFGFNVTDARIRASGASDSWISVSEKLDAQLSGASVVVYRGAPVVTTDLSGSSAVRRE